MRNLGPTEVPRGQENKGAMWFPNAVVLGASGGFERLAIRAVLCIRTVGMIRDGAPYERREALWGGPIDHSR